MPKAEEMKQFGEMGVLKTTKKIRGKLENRGIPVMYLGRGKRPCRGHPSISEPTN